MINRSSISILAVLADRDRQAREKMHQLQLISILAVLADRDLDLPGLYAGLRDFNPRGPCGPRLNTGKSEVP